MNTNELIIQGIKNKMETEKYRFDNSYGKVYELDGNSYIFIGTYFAFGITKRMPKSKKIRIVEEG